MQPPKQSKEYHQIEEHEFEKEIMTHFGGGEHLTRHFTIGCNATSAKEDE